MKERPILFSGPMVRAMLDRRKTVTRRAYTYRPQDHVDHPRGPLYCLPSPYGAPGDRLWVREPHYRFGHWEQVPGVRTKTGRQKWRFVPDTEEILYEAPAEYRKGRHHKDPETKAWHLRLPRFMPRAACRLVLPVVAVRLERLQDISEADARAEGIERHVDEGVTYYGPHDRGIACPITAFSWLWDSINGQPRKRSDGSLGPDISWKANPWVFVVTFEVPR